MALAFTANFTFRDDKGKSSSTKIRIPTSFTVAQAVEFAQDAAGLLAVASNGVITDVSLSVDVSAFGLGLKTVAGITADFFQKALFTMRSAVNGLFSKINVPTFNEDLVLAGTDQIDQADTDIAAFITALEDGIDDGLGTFIQPIDLRGNAITEVSAAREVFRKS